MYLRGDPASYRAEMARHGITRTELADQIGMNRQQLSMLLAGSRPMRAWAAHNIGLGINRLVGRPIFDVADDLGVLPANHGRSEPDLAITRGSNIHAGIRSPSSDF